MSIIESFLNHNKSQSAQFVAPDQTLWRRQYRTRYPVAIAVTKCMDGRINFPVITNTPPGIIQPFRNLGGKFDIGSHFGNLLVDWENRVVKVEGRDAIILVTYHWSKGLKERGCKGFHQEVESAREYTRELLQNMEKLFGKKRMVVYPIQVGIETDEDALVFHGKNGETLDLSEVKSDNPETLREALRALLPDMKTSLVDSLIPLCVGNIKHIREIRQSNRPASDIEHKENILGIGRGFDPWFHLPNRMLIVGPYSFDLATPIVVAGGILLDNLKAGRIPRNDGIALVASAVFRDQTGPEPILAEFKVRALVEFALKSLKEAKELKELIPHLHVAAGILNENNLMFTQIDL